MKVFLNNQTGFLPVILAQGAGAIAAVLLVAGPTVDRGVNCGLGRDCQYTISGEDGKLRNEGNQAAAKRCEFWNFAVGWVDPILYGNESNRAFAASNADHCEKWRMSDSGELEAAKAKLIPIDYALPEWNHPRRHQIR